LNAPVSGLKSQGRSHFHTEPKTIGIDCDKVDFNLPFLERERSAMQLTKTDFIQYINCPKSLWLHKRDPDAYPKGDFSVFLKKLIRERYVKQFFKNEDGREVDFQSAFESDDGLFSRADALERTAGGKVILYEIKSSTRVKTGAKHNHIKDYRSS
jgi:CRISPR/Cas system-associated exonuclease Cas4 (RecB family)